MDKIDIRIKQYLEKKAALTNPGNQRMMAGPSAEDFYLFVTTGLEGEALERMLRHLRHHTEDQAFVADLRDVLEKTGESEREAISPELIERVKGFSSGTAQKMLCPHCGKPITPFKRPLKQQKLIDFAWLLAAVISFALSFIFRHFFYQFLVITILAGAKWIVDKKATKTQILIYKALQEDSQGKQQDLHRLSAHL